MYHFMMRPIIMVEYLYVNDRIDNLQLYKHVVEITYNQPPFVGAVGYEIAKWLVVRMPNGC